MKKYKHGLFVLKGSPVHKGHKHIFKIMEKECDYLTIIFGSAQEENTKKIPFYLKERLKMAWNCFDKLKVNNTRLLVSYLRDIFNMDLWSGYVLEHVSNLRSLPVDVYYSGSEEDSFPFRNQKDITIEIFDREVIAEKNNYKSGTEIREMIYNKNSDCFKYVPKENWKMIRRLLMPV